MKFFIIFWILNFYQFSKADTILVPDLNVSFELYKEHCAKPGYICTTNFNLERIQNQSTPQFDLLLNDLDYLSENFRKDLAGRSLNILKNEMLSVEQIEILLKLLEQAQDFSSGDKIKQLQTIKRQLEETLQLLQNNPLPELTESFFVVFKRPTSEKNFKKIDQQTLRIKAAKIDFNRDSETRLAFVQGQCELAQVHSLFQNEKWLIDSNQNCHFSQTITKAATLTSEFVQEHKTALVITGLAAVGAALLLKNYDVQFSF